MLQLIQKQIHIQHKNKPEPLTFPLHIKGPLQVNVEPEGTVIPPVSVIKQHDELAHKIAPVEFKDPTV